MGMYAALGISASGLAAERLRMDVIASNLANADSTNGVGDAYHRKAVVMAESSGSGAQFSLPRPAGVSSTGDGTGDLNGVAVTGIAAGMMAQGRSPRSGLAAFDGTRARGPGDGGFFRTRLGVNGPARRRGRPPGRDRFCGVRQCRMLPRLARLLKKPQRGGARAPVSSY